MGVHEKNQSTPHHWCHLFTAGKQSSSEILLLFVLYVEEDVQRARKLIDRYGYPNAPKPNDPRFLPLDLHFKRNVILIFWKELYVIQLESWEEKVISTYSDQF